MTGERQNRVAYDFGGLYASPGSVLIVDDVPENLRALTAILAKAGYRARQAPNGEMALRSALANPPELILLDIRMPGMDGYEVCARLKDDPSTRDIPVIFISALNDVGDKVKAFESGGVDYIIKPFQEEEVVARVSAHLELRHLHQDLEARVRERTRRLNEVLAALEASETRYRNIIAQASDAIFLLDGAGRVQDVNQRACDNLGFTREELLNGALKQVDPELGGHFREVVGRLAADGRVITESVHRRKDGTSFPVEVSIARVTEQAPSFFVAIARDISERRKAEEEQRRLHEQLKLALIRTIAAIAALIEKRDPYTAGHQRRTAQLAEAIARSMGLADEQIEVLRLGALIHDIGKVSIPAEILTKPSRLTELEYELVKTHPEAGYDIVKEVDFPGPVAQIVLQHHERLDGSGYPRGLKGEEITLEARILAVADVAEAIQSHRPYRPAKGIDATLQELHRGRGVLYDAEAVDACVALLTENRFTFS